MYKIDIKWIDGPNESPFWIVQLKSQDVAKQIADRSVSLRSVIKLWGSGKTLKELHESIRNYPKEIIQSFLHIDLSFRVNVETFGKTFTMKEKVDKIEMFNYLPAYGPVKLSNPDVNLFYIEYYGLDPCNLPEEPYSLYFGVWVRITSFNPFEASLDQAITLF